MAAGSPRQLLPVDAAIAAAVGGLAFLSTRWDSWWDGPGRRAEMPMRHGGPPFRAPDPDLVATTPAPTWLVGVGIAMIMVGLALRRLNPRSGYVVVVVGTTAFLAAGGPYGPALLAPALAVLGLAMILPTRRWTPWLAALPVMMTAGFWREPYGGLLDPGIWLAALFGSAAVILPALLVLIRRARREADARDREAERDRYVYAERMRIAREVHDVVGHSLSVIHLQAGVALHVLDKRPQQVAESLEAIRVTSKDALSELRHTLDVFRDTDGPDPTRPQAGLAQLDELVAPLRAAGRSVEVRTSDDLRGGLPATVDHAAYRIVQEALTNVVRHAGGASVIVELTLADGRLQILVSDDGPPVGTDDLRPGNGMRGMQERAAAVGGALVVRPGAGARGAVVEASLPIMVASVDQ